METTLTPRTKRFRWRSKHTLYEYFRKYYDLDEDDVDVEIARTMREFYPRKGQAIKTVELWQKVGLNLEQNNELIHELPEESYDYGIIDSYVVNEKDTEGVRNLFTLTDPDLFSVSGYSASDFIFRKKRE